MRLPALPISPLSPGGAVYSDYLQGRMPREQYLAENAVIVSDNLHWYGPKLYMRIPDAAESYANGRIQGRHSYDRPSAQLMSSWARTVLIQKDENDSNLSLVLWAEEILAKHKLEGANLRLKDTARRFASLQFPFDLYERVLRVQVLDSRERMQAS